MKKNKINDKNVLIMSIFLICASFILFSSLYFLMPSKDLVGSAIVNVNSCYDTQLGFNKNVKGTISGQKMNGAQFSIDDYCVDTLNLWEFYCIDMDSYNQVLVNCDDNEICQNGACITYTSSQESCEVLSDGVLYTNHLGEQSLLLNDCYGNFGRRIEYSCNGNKYLEQLFDCQNGCLEGICNTGEPFISCQDSDNGIDIYTYGEVTRTYQDEVYFAKDKCLSEKKVVEQYCDGNVWRYTVLDCPDNSFCSEGRCVEACTFGSCSEDEVCIGGQCLKSDLLGDGTRGICPDFDWCTNYGGDTCNYTVYNNGTDLFLNYFCSNELNPGLPENWVYDIMALQIQTTGLGIDLRSDSNQFSSLFVEGGVKTGDYIGAFYMDGDEERCAGFTDLKLGEMNMLYITTDTQSPYVAEGPAEHYDDIYLKYFSKNRQDVVKLGNLDWHPNFFAPQIKSSQDTWAHTADIFWILKEASD